MDIPIRTIFDIIKRVDNNLTLNRMMRHGMKALKMTDKRRKQLIERMN